jgi:hypothetical protein
MAITIRDACNCNFLDWAVGANSGPLVLRLYPLFSGELYSDESTACIPFTTFSATLQIICWTLLGICACATLAFPSWAAHCSFFSPVLVPDPGLCTEFLVPGHSVCGLFAISCTLGFFVLGCVLQFHGSSHPLLLHGCLS